MVVVLGEYLAWYLGVLEREAIAPEAKWAVLEGNITVSLCVNMDKESGKLFRILTKIRKNPPKSENRILTNLDESGKNKKILVWFFGNF